MRGIIIVMAALGIASCSQSEQPAAPKKASAEAKAPARPAFCFFKDSETKGWAAKRNAKGDIIVSGKAYRSDPRYQAMLGAPEIVGDVATLAPSIGQNSGYASLDNWWDVTATIPASASVKRVRIACGKKTLAELPVP